MKILFVLAFSGITIFSGYLLISAYTRMSDISTSEKLKRSIKTGMGTVLFAPCLLLLYGVLQQNDVDPLRTGKIFLLLSGCFLPLGLIAAVGTFIRLGVSGWLNKKISGFNELEK